MDTEAMEVGTVEGELLALEGRELDAALGLTVGKWECVKAFGKTWLLRTEYKEEYPGERWGVATTAPDDDVVIEVGLYMQAWKWMQVPEFHCSFDALRPYVEKCIEDCGLGYVHALEDAVKHSVGVVSALSCLQATPTDQARAVILAYDRRASTGTQAQPLEHVE